MPGQPPPLEDEGAQLLVYIAQQRDGLRYAAYGLTDEQARLAPTAGTLTIGGLIKHVTAMEQNWIDMVLQRRRERPVDEQESSYGDDFRFGPDDTVAEVLAGYDEVARETEAVVRSESVV